MFLYINFAIRQKLSRPHLSAMAGAASRTAREAAAGSRLLAALKSTASTLESRRSLVPASSTAAAGCFAAGSSPCSRRQRTLPVVSPDMPKAPVRQRVPKRSRNTPGASRSRVQPRSHEGDYYPWVEILPIPTHVVTPWVTIWAVCRSN